MNKEILLVDDDAVTNFVNQTIMESKFPGIPIKLFYNGSVAMQYILKNTDKNFLVFLDLNMPVMSGWEFLKALEGKKAELNIEIHILTSSIDPGDQEHAAKFPLVSSFLVKPLDETILEGILHKIVKNKM
ncbi:response regulator [Flagellimonas lutimaris]|jgi:CheY-like chemotaxis protein|uniref:response regulator n=1 Tax=Flagellimonas TaxID=444459 RepID=UPI000B6E3657|nr:MAG: response regulator [Muricauda sp. TMED12]|tara:strand:+ start:40244 stop:40633 length:390 start_codon:yes stop_codon:yes gene_type:complete